jgi:SAM-dependent methyltransferase
VRPGAVVNEALIVGPQTPLPERYIADAVRIFDPDERARFLDASGAPRQAHQVAWELLYRLEPALYARLVAGERLHDGILRWLPTHCRRVLEIGAGAGRLTLELARRSAHVTAVEPAGPLRELLRQRLDEVGAGNVDVVRGFFDDLPAPLLGHDLVISCSAFAAGSFDDPDRRLEEMASLCAPGGLLVLVWPSDVSWLRARGLEHTSFAGPMVVGYQSLDEALTLARIFYPDAVATIARMGSRFVDYATIGLNPPRDLCWKRCP